MKKTFLFLFLSLFLLISLPLSATVRFANPSATGSANGSSWSNGYATVAQINTAMSGWSAGDTLCMAAGTYSSGTSEIFVTVSGTSGHPVTFKRALTSDTVCGSTTAGWNSGFDGLVTVGGFLLSHTGPATNFITIEGGVPNGMLMMVANTTGSESAINVEGPSDSVFIHNVEIGQTGCTASGCNQNGDSRAIDMNIFTGSNYALQSNWLIDHVYMHGQCTIMWAANSSNLVIQYSKFADAIDNTPGNPNCHPNVMAAQDAVNATFRYNEVTNWQVEGIMVFNTNNSAWTLYGNVWHDPHSGSFPRVFEVQQQTIGPIIAYNNTFVNIPFATFTTSAAGVYSSGSAGLNNIYISSAGSALPSNDFDACNGSTCSETHGQNIATSIFTNFSAGTLAGYELASNTAAGQTLSSPYNVDMLGNTRGADGVASRGAFQFVSEAKVLTGITILPPAEGYHLAGRSSTLQMSPLCTYDDGSTDNCSTQTLTWGTSNDSAMTVNSTGLVSYGPSYGGSITGIVRSGGVVSVITASNFRVPLNVPLLIQGVTDTSFNGTYAINNGSYNVNASGNTIGYNQAGANSSSSGGGLYFAGAIDVYAMSGAILGHHIINIDSSVLSSITVRPETDSSDIVVGSTVLVSAEDSTTDPVGGPAIGDYCAWTSSAPSVATVDYIGNVTGIAPGTAIITCTLGSVTGTRSVTVYSPVLANKTWYVRSDGGALKNTNNPSGQCDGTLDVPLAGSTGGHCAVNNPMYLSTDESSSSAYTGLVGPGDTAIIHPAVDGTPYKMGGKSQNVAWVTWGKYSFPSGTPAQHTRILGSNYANCSDISSMTKVLNYWSGGLFNVEDNQNVDIECLDMSNWADCNQGLQNVVTFACPANTANPDGIKSQIPILADTFSGDIHLSNVYIHGFTNSWDGTPGPGLVMTNVIGRFNWQAGFDFDDPFGYNGNRTEGFQGDHLEASYSGYTEELDKPVTSVVRDGSGNVIVSFDGSQIVNYRVNTNIVLKGMTPLDLNGTYPVAAVNFNQQIANVTGGSCTQEFDGSAVEMCTFTTDAKPTFGVGAFVQITNLTPAWLNGYYEVQTVTDTGFGINASSLTHPGWSSSVADLGVTFTTSGGHITSAVPNGVGSNVFSASLDMSKGGNADAVITANIIAGQVTSYTIVNAGTGYAEDYTTAPISTNIAITSAGGTASTTLSVTASAPGIAESASVLGFATHVIPGHRGQDQHIGGYADGDGVGTGNNTIGNWYCFFCKFMYNLQDGYDMLHSAMGTSEYMNSFSVGNSGAPAKFGNSDIGIFFNNVGIANCAASLAFNPDFPPDYNQYITTPCRAGDAFPFNGRMWSKMTITNNTFMSGFNTMLDDGCSDAGTAGQGCQTLPSFVKFEMQNNIFVGYMDTNNPVFNSSLPGMYCGSSCNNTPNLNALWTWTNNIGFNVRGGPDGDGNNWALDPGLMQIIPNIGSLSEESNALNYNVNLSSISSAAQGFGIQNADVPATDQTGQTRTNPPAAGALEFNVGTLLTVTVAPPSASMFPMATTAFTASCSYSTGATSPCSVTWTDTNTHSSVNSVTGVVMGISVGTDTVTATLNSVFGTATVVIAAPPPFYTVRGAILSGAW